MKQKFEDIRLGTERLARIQQANKIIEEHMAQGYVLTLRQIYYQFVGRGLIENKQTEYKRLGELLNVGRLAGLVDWSAMEDRTRNLVAPSTWASPAEIVRACASQFKLDVWKDQPLRVEVFIEKDALVGVIEKPCSELRVPYFSCRGYTSQSELYAAGRRLNREWRKNGKRTLIIHFGDHDPSGIDMTRDIQERVSMFAGYAVEVRRVALNRDQVDEFDLPPNPAKLTDSRCEGYIAEHGDESWELDALSAKFIDELVRKHVADVVDKDAMEAALLKEEECRKTLEGAAREMEEDQES